MLAHDIFINPLNLMVMITMLQHAARANKFRVLDTEELNGLVRVMAASEELVRVESHVERRVLHEHAHVSEGQLLMNLAARTVDGVVTRRSHVDSARCTLEAEMAFAFELEGDELHVLARIRRSLEAE